MTRRKEQISWYFYDWANSAFYTTVATVFLGPYLTTIAKNAADTHGFIYPFGIQINAGSLFPYTVSTAVLLQLILLPFIGAAADYSHTKKQFLAFFAYLGASATMGLYFLHGTHYVLGSTLFIIANVSFGASIVFYNAFLPEIASPEQRDTVSSEGWALGYLGGGTLLALNLLLLSYANTLGITTGHAVRISFFSAGMWWAVFTLIPLLHLKNTSKSILLNRKVHYVTQSFKQLKQTFFELKKSPHTLLFLCAFLLYNDGIQSVIVLSSLFGQEELGLSMSTLTTVILIVQFAAFFGSILFKHIAAFLGNKNSIMLSLIIWTGTLVYTFAYLKTKAQFYIVAIIIAIVLGGSQALSRSLYSLIIPRGKESEYFSFYEISERGTSWLGPLLFGLAYQFSRNYRVSILSLIVFFVFGFILLFKTNIRQATLEAGNESR